MASISSTSDPNSVIAASRQLASPTSLLFPNDAEIGVNRFLISFSTYKGPLTGSSVDATQSRTYSTNKITLPIPQSGLDNNFSIDYDATEFGLAGGIATKILQGRANQETFGQMMNDDTFAGIKDEGARRLASGVSTALFDIVGNTSGASIFNSLTGSVRNPNLAATFQGVGLRTHSFSWRFAPKTAAESKTLRTIITTLKQCSLPSRNQNQNYTLLYPDTATITVSGSSNPLIDFSKTGLFLKDVGIKYDGVQAAFYQGSGEPVITDLTLSFIDRSIVTREDVS